MRVTAHEVVAAIRPVVMAAAVALVVCGVFLTVIESRANDRLYRNQLASCEGTNAVREVIHEALLIAQDAVGGNPAVEAEFARLDGRVWPPALCSQIIERP